MLSHSCLVSQLVSGRARQPDSRLAASTMPGDPCTYGEEPCRKEVFTKHLLVSKGKGGSYRRNEGCILCSVHKLLNAEGRHLSPNPKVATDT